VVFSANQISEITESNDHTLFIGWSLQSFNGVELIPWWYAGASSFKTIIPSTPILSNVNWVGVIDMTVPSNSSTTSNTLSWYGLPWAVVHISKDAEIATAIVDNAGTWTATIDLVEGSNRLTLKQSLDILDTVSTNGTETTIIVDTIPPSPPSSFNANTDIGSISSAIYLSWVNPISDFANISIRRSTLWYPTSIADGTSIAAATNITSTNYTDAGLANGTYYYSIFARDAVGNISLAAHATANLIVDNSAPILSAGWPTAQQWAGTTTVNMQITTNEKAYCKYNTVPNATYSSMPNMFTLTGTTSHIEVLTNLTNGTNYTYYVRCSDIGNNSNTTDYTISFSIAAISWGGGGGGGGGGGWTYVAPPIISTKINNTVADNDVAPTQITVPSDVPIVNNITNNRIWSTFLYISEDKNIVSQLQKHHPMTNLTETMYKNICETEQWKNYYKTCISRKKNTSFEDLLESVTCEKFIVSQSNKNDYEFSRTAPRKEVVAVALKMKRNKGISVPLVSSTEGQKILQPIYADIGKGYDSAPWLTPVVATALNQGLITRNRTIFEPERDVTRAEAFSMIMKSVCMMPLEDNTKNNWQDVVYAIAKTNHITVRTSGDFAPNTPILRQELITIAGRAVEWAERTGGCNPKPDYCFVNSFEKGGF
jgi:hypothetical protein